MCPFLLHPSEATDQQLRESINKKLAKFGSLEKMPPETRFLVEAGMAEVMRRAEEKQGYFTKRQGH